MNEDLIKSLLLDHQSCHSQFQITKFIIGNAGTPWFRYKQALREIDVRYEQLLVSSEDLVLLDIELQEKREQLKKKGGQTERKIKTEIEITRLLRMIEKNQKKKTELEFELDQFVSLALCEKKKLGELTEEKKIQLEIHGWKQKMQHMIIIDMCSFGKLQKPTIEMIACFAPETQKELLSMANSEITQINEKKTIDK